MRWDEKGEKKNIYIYPQAPLCCQKSGLQFAHKWWKNADTSCAHCHYICLPQLSAAQVQLRAGITRGQWDGKDRACMGSWQGTGTTGAHQVSAVWESRASTVGLQLPGLITAVSKQHFHPTRVLHTHPSPGPMEHRKDKRFSHRTVGLDVDGSGSH